MNNIKITLEEAELIKKQIDKESLMINKHIQ